MLDRTAPRVLALPMVGLGVVAAFLGLVGAGGRVARSRYRPDPWQIPEWLVLASGVAVATLAVVASHEELLAAYPPLTGWPVLSVTHLVAGKYSWLLGGVPRSGPPAKTFETLIRQLGFGLFPWSAVARHCWLSVYSLKQPTCRGSPTIPPMI